MPSTVQKWGNSLGVRIPKALAEEVRLAEGSEVEINAADGVITIRPRRRQKRRRNRPSLAELLAKFKPEHRHGELNNSPPRGRELI